MKDSQSQIEYIRSKLIEAENSVKKNGWVTQSRHEMLAEFKEELRKAGKLKPQPPSPS